MSRASLHTLTVCTTMVAACHPFNPALLPPDGGLGPADTGVVVDGQLQDARPADAPSGSRDSGLLDAALSDSRVADAPVPDASAGDSCDGTSSLSGFEAALVDMEPDSWFSAPSSHLRDVCVSDSAGLRGVVGCQAVVSAWSGAAYDSDQRRLLVWGGGQTDYWGNELYAFDLTTGRWSRAEEPSVVPAGVNAPDFLNRDPLPDGHPVSRHTYDGLAYLTSRHALFGHGGSRAMDGEPTLLTWLYDVDGWHRAADGPGGYSLAAAYDRLGDRVYVHAAESFHVYDVATDAWTSVPGFGEPPLWPRYAVSGDKTCAIDTLRRLYWSVGSGQFFVWDIDAERAVTDSWISSGAGVYRNDAQVSGYPDQSVESGGGDVFDASAPGLAYDSAADALVAWPNAGAPRILNLSTKVWSEGTAAGAPSSSTSGGTYGRWRYLQRYNVFILLTSVDDDVHFYKSTGGCG